METPNNLNLSSDLSDNSQTTKKKWAVPTVEIISVQSGSASGSEAGSGAPYVPVS